MRRFRYWTGEEIGKPDPVVHKDCYLVSTTNVEGRHGLGLAKTARDYWGAKYGQARGFSGKCWLLPTKNLTKDHYEKETGIIYRRYGRRSLTKEQIRSNVVDLYNAARENPDKSFIVAYKRTAKNLNGYSAEEIFRIFTWQIDVPKNIVFHESWKGYYN
ncbi:A1S_2505 family phage non-structural protein [Vibrio crassostreae]|uniref:A1S_2505 family phage non-structural protein n=1 Tax=Vibrio crassostreae TaxID=246167 RepID=UPI001B3119DC|nr:hypothetical protein [Vibrio crassostreae]